MPSCNTYHLTWVSLTLGVGYLFMAAPAKRSRCSLPWTRGISSLPPLVSNCLRHCRLWLSRLLSQGRGFYMQKYWYVWANTGWHTLLEHYISCCPRHQLPWVPGAARPTVTQAVASPHLAPSQGQTQSPPGQSQEQTPVDDSHSEVGIKPHLEPRGSVFKEEDRKPSYHLYRLQIKST